MENIIRGLEDELFVLLAQRRRAIGRADVEGEAYLTRVVRRLVDRVYHRRAYQAL